MKQKLDIKSAIEVAVQKEMAIPDETTGLVEYRFGATLKTEDESLNKASKSDHTEPDEDDMFLINALAKEPQDPSNWMILRGVNPLGNPQEVDSDGDVFAPASVKDMSEQAYGTPILTDHNHELGSTPPVGMVIRAKVSKGMLRETWAIPKEDYNANIRKGLLNGTINKISIGAFIAPADKVCNSCGNGRSIYSIDCSHIPGRNDEKGNMCTVTVRRVKRYAERSLVNIPARMGTSVKDAGANPIEKGIQPEPTDASFSQEIEIEPTIKSFDLKEVITNLSEIKALTSEEIKLAIQDALKDVFGEDNAPPATISDVISEDSIVSEEKDVKAPEAEEASEKQEDAAVEAPASEEEAQAPEVKSVEVPVVKSLEVEEFTKSLKESLKLEVEPINKALAEANEKFSTLKEFSEKQAADLKTLTETVQGLVEQVVKLASFSSDEAIEKLLEVAGQIKEQVAPAAKKPQDLESFVKTLVAKK